MRSKYSTPINRSYGPKHDHLTVEREAWREMIVAFAAAIPLPRPIPARRIRVGGR